MVNNVSGKPVVGTPSLENSAESILDVVSPSITCSTSVLHEPSNDKRADVLNDPVLRVLRGSEVGGSWNVIQCADLDLTVLVCYRCHSINL